MSYPTESYDKISNYIEEMKQKYPVDETELVGDGKVFYMNTPDGTMENWNNDGHVCEFVIFYNDGWGYMKVTANKDGTITGYVFTPTGQSPVQKMPIRSMTVGEAQELCALMNKIADKRGLYNKPVDELDVNAPLGKEDKKGIVLEDDDESSGMSIFSSRRYRGMGGSSDDDDEIETKKTVNPDRYYEGLTGHNKVSDEKASQSSYGSIIGRAHDTSTEVFHGEDTVKARRTAPRKRRTTRASRRPFTNKPFRMPPEIAKYIIKRPRKPKASVKMATKTSARMVNRITGRRTAPVKIVKRKTVQKKSLTKNKYSYLENSVRRMF